jgi:hypothetical protein
MSSPNIPDEDDVEEVLEEDAPNVKAQAEAYRALMALHHGVAFIHPEHEVLQ